MPTVRTVSIASNPDPLNPRPWFALAADPGGALAVEITEANGIREFSRRGVAAGRLPGAAVTAQKQAALRRRHALALSTAAREPDEEPADPARPELADEVHVLAVTVAGDVEFVPTSRQAPVYYAHLAWYDPLDDEWLLLDFADEPAGDGS